MLRLTPDTRNLVFDQLEIWDLYALSRACKHLRNEVKLHGALSACNRIRRMPTRTKQFVANRVRANLISESYSPILTSSTAMQTRILTDARLCSGDWLSLTHCQVRGYVHGFEILLSGKWTEQPIIMDQNCFIIRYFTLYDRVYIRFMLEKHLSDLDPGDIWVTAKSLLDHIGVHGYTIIHLASRISTKLQFTFAPYFSEAVEPILQEIKAFETRHRGRTLTPCDPVYEDMPALVDGGPVLNPFWQM